MAMPKVEPIVYVGNDVFSEGKSDICYFQDAVSVSICGIIGEGDDVYIYPAGKDKIGHSIVCIESLTSIIVEVLKKYNESGKPKICQEKGNR